MMHRFYLLPPQVLSATIVVSLNGLLMIVSSQGVKSL